MVDIGLTRMSSKGQIVIPVDMRKMFKKGDKIIVIEGRENLILKKASKLDEIFSEDLKFAKRTEEAWKRIKSGEYISVDSGNLIEEMEKW